MFSPATARRKRHRGIGPAALVAVVLLAAAAAAATVIVLGNRDDGRRAAARRYVSAWTRGDAAAMWRALDARSQARLGAVSSSTVRLGRVMPSNRLWMQRSSHRRRKAVLTMFREYHPSSTSSRFCLRAGLSTRTSKA